MKLAHSAMISIVLTAIIGLNGCTVPTDIGPPVTVSENVTQDIAITTKYNAQFQKALDAIEAAKKSASYSIANNQTAIVSDNVTGKTSKIPPSFAHKKHGQTLVRSTTTLTQEQQAFVDKQIEEKLKLIDASLIRFPSGYSTHTKPGTIEAGIQDGEKIPAHDFYIIQFYTDQSRMHKDTRETLQQSGCVLYDYVANNAFYCMVPPEALDTVISLVKDGKVRYLGYIPTEAKISPQLLAETQKTPDSSFDLVVYLLGEVNQSDIDSLKSFMQVDSYYPVPYIVYGIAKGSSINAIAPLNFVKWIGEETSATLY